MWMWLRYRAWGPIIWVWGRAYDTHGRMLAIVSLYASLSLFWALAVNQYAREVPVAGKEWNFSRSRERKKGRERRSCWMKFQRDTPGEYSHIHRSKGTCIRERTREYNIETHKATIPLGFCSSWDTRCNRSFDYPERLELSPFFLQLKFFFFFLYCHFSFKFSYTQV